MKNFKIIIYCCLFVAIVNQSFAGPLRDWLAEKKASSHQDTFNEDDDKSTFGTNIPQGVRLMANVPYGSDKKQKMDIYMPEKFNGSPVIFMVHGGAWRTGDKASIGVIENKVARWVPKGIIFISVNYRLLPEASPLIQSEDVIKALAQAQADAEKWGGDSSKFILMGHSAGAHLVSLISADPQKALKAGARPWLGTVSLDSAAYDIVEIMNSKHYRFYDKAFGNNQSFWQSASPFYALSAGAKPFFSVCSTIRPDSPCIQAKKFADKAKTLGVRVEVSEQSMTHAEINKNLGVPGAYTNSVELFMASLDDSFKILFSGKER